MALFFKDYQARKVANKNYKQSLAGLLTLIGTKDILAAESAAISQNVKQDVLLYSDQKYIFMVKVNSPSLELDEHLLLEALVNQGLTEDAALALIAACKVSKEPSKTFTITEK